MIIKTIDNFSLSQICQSGQCFRMSRSENGEFIILAGDKHLRARQQGNECSFDCSEDEFENFWKPYFDLEQDYGSYLEKVDSGDAYLCAAAKYGSGIRILRQDLWEMIVSFLISQQNNIVRIRRCIQNICEAYGEKKRSGSGEVYYAFPKPEALAGLDEDALKACNLGYRSKYVVRAARSVVSGSDGSGKGGGSCNAVDLGGNVASCAGIDLEAIRRMPYPEAREKLLTLYGVGKKVADCICLFALHHLEAFPVDTHINQALEKHYQQGFPENRYQGMQGVMQQYIFYYELFGAEI